MPNNEVQLADGTTAFKNEADSVNDLRIGGPASPTTANPRFIVPGSAKMALAALDTGGGVLSWVNPHPYAIIVQDFTLDVTTKSTGACTLDIGSTAVSATTSSNNLLTGVDVGTATGTFDNITNKGASGKSVQKLAVGAWITASKASGAAAGLVGYAYITYVPAT